MACQSNPETYAIVIRLPIEEGVGEGLTPMVV